MADYLRKFGKKVFAIVVLFVLIFAIFAQIINVIMIGELRKKTYESVDEVQENIDNIASDTLYSNYDVFMKNILDVEANSIKYVFDDLRLDVEYLSDQISYAYGDSIELNNPQKVHIYDAEQFENVKVYYDKNVDKKSKSIQKEVDTISSIKNVLYYTVRDASQMTSAYILTDTGLFFYTDNNDDVFENERIYGMRNQKWYEKARATNSTIIVESGEDAITGKKIISLMHSIYVDNDFKGIAGVDIFLEDLNFANTALAAPEEFNIFLTDVKGEIIYNARANKYNVEEAKKGTIYRFINDAITKESGQGIYNYYGNIYRAHYKKVKNTNFTLFISIRDSKIKKYIATLSNLINDNNNLMQVTFDGTIAKMVIFHLILVTLIAIFIFVVAREIAKRMSLPLSKLSEVLNVASKIQKDMLPKDFEDMTKRKDIEVAAVNVPEAEVGGDFYNYILKDNKLFLIIADVSGSGIPAALFMAKASELLASAIELTDSPKAILSYVNSELCKNNNEYYFLTIALYCVNLMTREVVSANSGHEDSIVLKKNGEIIKINETRVAPMGLVEYNNYVEDRFMLDVGDILFLYTDGVVEAINTNDELYGIKRLENALSKIKTRSTKDVIGTVKEDVDKFSKGTMQYDDITMLCFKFRELEGDQKLIYDFEKDFESKYYSIDDINKYVKDSLSEAYEGNDKPYKDYLSKMYVCCEEVVVNIIDHAYGGENDDYIIKIKILIDRNADKISITFIDDGKEFDPTRIIEPNVFRSIGDVQEGGWGIHITKKTMDIMEYKFENNKNVLTITKYF